MANFKRRKPKRQVTCYMCQWYRSLGNGKDRLRPKDRGPKKVPVHQA